MTGNEVDTSIGAPILKRDVILDHLRTLIVTGELKPGRRMPARSKIKNRFKTGRSSVDQAFEQLEEDGFVRNEPRQGTYVSEHPPHLCHYAVIMQGPREGVPSAFDAALREEAAAMRREGTGRLIPYENVAPGTPEYQRLMEDIAAHRVAGLILRQGTETDPAKVMPPRMPGVPYVTIAAHPVPGFVNVVTDYASLARKAMAWLAARGRKRVVCLIDHHGGPVYTPPLEAILQESGLSMPPEQCHVIAQFTARTLVALLMRLPPPERPDALFVDDDNLVEQASLGLLNAGVRVGEDLDVVGHCNFSSVTASHVPMKRLGWDDRQLLRECMAQIDRMRAGEESPPPVAVAPLFDHEMGKVKG